MKNEKKLFKEMFSIGTLYNSACSNADNQFEYLGLNNILSL